MLRRRLYCTIVAIIACAAVAVPSVAHAGYTLVPTGETESGISTVNIMRGSTDVGNLRVNRSLTIGTNKWGNSHVEVELQNTSNFTATTPVESGITAYTKWEWTHDGQDSTTLYRFDCDVVARVYADAALDIEGLTFGYGKIVTHAWGKLECDTANSDGKLSEKDVWAGAEVIQEAGGLTGIGIGATELSIDWSDTIPQSTAPGESFLVYVSILEYDDDPGSRCGIKFSTSASAKAYATRDTTSYMFQDKSKAFAEIDTTYGDLDLEGPRLINP